jgi:hypothetical protein
MVIITEILLTHIPEAGIVPFVLFFLLLFQVMCRLLTGINKKTGSKARFPFLLPVNLQSQQITV